MKLVNFIGEYCQHWIEKALIAGLKDKYDIGAKKYGTALEDANCTEQELAQHAFEEVQDAINYLCCLSMQHLSNSDTEKVKEAQEYAFVIKSLCEILNFLERKRGAK